MEKKVSVVDEAKSVETLAKSMKEFGKENTIVAFFMVIMILFVGWNQYSNYRVMEDNRAYYKEQKENMAKIVATNENLVRIVDTKIADIANSLNISSDKSNTYILEEVIIDGEKVLKPRKIKR